MQQWRKGGRETCTGGGLQVNVEEVEMIGVCIETKFVQYMASTTNLIGPLNIK
jgi:hypothetical protein